jgi:hypothetical protein
VPYGELDALRFKAELEVAQRELEDVVGEFRKTRHP